jgi:rhodanese-related sulfurtransferase
MLDRRFFAEGTAIVVLAVLCASISNYAAARDRKVAWVGDYPRALQFPVRPAEPATETTATAAIDTMAVETPTATASAAQSTQAPVTATSPSTAKVPASTFPAPQVKLPAGLQARPRKIFAPHPNVASVDITSEDAMQLWHEKAIFLDARRTDVYQAGRIKGARSMPVWEADIDERIRALFSEVTDQQQPIVIYCSGGACEDSHMLAEKLWGAGYENLLVYKDGFPAWQKMGGAVE